MATKTIGKKTFEQMLEEWQSVIPAEAKPPQGFLPLDVLADNIAERKGITHTGASAILRRIYLDGKSEKLIGPRWFNGKRCSNIWYRLK